MTKPDTGGRGEGRTIEELAAEFIATKTGIGMTPPFYAETASAKG